MSDLNTILEKYKARSGDEQNFMDKHTDNVNVTDAPHGDTAKKVIDKMKKHDRKKTRQGLEPEEEEDMYESNEHLVDMIDVMIREYYEEDATPEEQELLDEMMSSAEGYQELVDMILISEDEDEDDDEEDDEDDEEDDDEVNEEVEQLDESFGAFTKKIMARFKGQFDYQDYHFELAKKLVADTVGSNSPQGKKILKQHEKLSILTKYDALRPELAREKLFKNIDLLYNDIKDAEHSVKFRKDWEAGAKATAERLAANIAKSEKRKQDIERAKKM